MEMKKTVDILLTALLMVAACACHKEDSYITDMPISLSLTEAGSTKALLDAETFETAGNRIKIYDYYTDGSVATGYYIDDVIKCSTPGLWPFEGGSHKWTTDGVHKFFGWLVDDATLDNENALFTPTFDEGFKELTIPETTLGQNTPQFDFMYSDIHERDLNNNPYFTAVPLNFSHLFTAFKVTAANKSSNTVYLKKVTITGLKNRRSVTISYDGDKPVVNYIYPADTKKSDFIYEVSDSGLELNKEATNISSPSDDEYTLMWAHSKEDFAEAKIVVEYNYQEPNNPLNNDGKTTVEMKDLNWEAGSKNVLGLIFKDKEIALTCKVEPWNMVVEEIDFSDQISVSKPITWEDGSYEYVNYDTGEIILWSDTSIAAVCNFHIDTPSGATWTASLIPMEGYSDAFAIVDGTKYGSVGIDSQIRICVTNKAPIAPRHVVKLRITVQTADGRTIIADLMPKNDQNEELKEFKIIQNLING